MAASDHMLKEAEKIMKMLDDLHESDPDEYKKFITKTLEEGKAEMNVADFRFSIHATCQTNSKKVFINVCSFPPVPAPKSDDDPISVHGGKSFAEDINGQKCIIEYLGINPKVLDEVGTDKQLQKMLIKLAIDFYNDTKNYNMSYKCGFSKKLVGNKSQLNLAFSISAEKPSSSQAPCSSPLNDVKLPFNVSEDDMDLNGINLNINTKDELTKNHGNLITELKSSELQEIKFSSSVVSKPRHSLKLEAQIEFIDSLDEIDLEIVDDEIVLTTGCFSETRHKIPHFDDIIEESVRAKFSKSKKLTITIDLKES